MVEIFFNADEKEKEFEHDVPHPVVSTKQVDDRIGERWDNWMM